MKDHIVLSPDKFKGTLTAPEVAAHLAAGLAAAGFGSPVTAVPTAGSGIHPETRSAATGHQQAAVPLVLLPVADGGDGTVDAVVADGFTRIEVEVTGPTGEPVLACYALQDVDAAPQGVDEVDPDRRIAVIELAEASGLRRLPGGPAPLTATSYGTGELIAHAVRNGVSKIVLGLGGSACTDGGAGMMQALGVRFLDANGNDLPYGGAALRDLARIDCSGPGVTPHGHDGDHDHHGDDLDEHHHDHHNHSEDHSHSDGGGDGVDHGHGRGHGHGGAAIDLASVEFVVASDVDNPLLGPNGAAAVYGPQKGATPDDVAVLEAGLARLAAICVHTHGLVGSAEHDGVVRGMGVAGQPGAGAAGGVGFAALAFLRAEIRPGIDYLLDLLEFERHVEGARLVITGEGSLDEQSLRGKAPIGVALAAAKHGVPVVAVCGRRTIDDDALHAAGISAAYALTDIEPDLGRCMTDPGPLLERLAQTIAATHLSTP